MTALNDNWRPSEQLVREVLQVLARAHRKLDEMGVPPAPPRPVLERTTW